MTGTKQSRTQIDALRHAHDTLGEACESVRLVMHQAVEDIDALFGRGFAREHPELVAGFMHAAALQEASYGDRTEVAIDTLATALSGAIDKAGDTLADRLGFAGATIAENLDKKSG